jgi:hypothetical protein
VLTAATIESASARPGGCSHRVWSRQGPADTFTDDRVVARALRIFVARRERRPPRDRRLLRRAVFVRFLTGAALLNRFLAGAVRFVRLVTGAGLLNRFLTGVARITASGTGTRRYTPDSKVRRYGSAGETPAGRVADGPVLARALRIFVVRRERRPPRRRPAGR